MGYTNYWSQPTDFTDKEWTLVQKEFDYIREIAGDKIDVEDVHGAIVFNGGKGGSCETFVIEKLSKKDADYKGQDLAFHFCKTRGMGYDIYVWHLLTFCQMIKKDFTCSRDGWAYDKCAEATDFKENEMYDLESYLGVNKSDHNLEGQIDSLIDEIKLFLNDESDKNSFIKDYNDWVKERTESESYKKKGGK